MYVAIAKIAKKHKVSFPVLRKFVRAIGMPVIVAVPAGGSSYRTVVTKENAQILNKALPLAIAL